MKYCYLTLTALLLTATGLHAQQTCATAQLLPGPGVYVCDTVDGAAAPVVCVGSGTATASAGKWYKYTPLANHYTTVSTVLSGNSGDTEVSIFTGGCGALTCVAGNDDAGGTTLSMVSFDAVAGNTYYIVFDNRWDATGFVFQLLEAPPGTSPGVPPITFTNETFSTGDGYNYCVVDLNGDYLDDVLAVTGANFKIARQQPGGGFSDIVVTLPAVYHNPTWSLTAGDLDANGINDLVFGGGSGVSFYLANELGTGYTHWTPPQYIFSQRGNMIDIDNDGHLDFFMCHDTAPNVYFMNDGAGNLVYHQGGMGDHPNGGNYGSVWVDYDNDGDPDLFIAKCRGGGSSARINELHRNDGGGVFTNVSAAANMADSVQTWSAAWADYDNDGDMDALVGASSLADGSHKLMRNNGDGTFTDITAGSGFELLGSLSLEYLTYDFDNNGYADVFCGGGIIMFNNGDMTFTKHTFPLSSGPCGDLNNDGFIDIQNSGKIHFNSGNSNNYVKLSLQGVQSNRNGIGARVELYSAPGKQIRDVRSGEGFRFMHSLNVHFGIGSNTHIDSAHIIWPSGIVDYLFDTTINTRLHIIEGSHPYPVPDTSLGIDAALEPVWNIHPVPATEVLYLTLPEHTGITSAMVTNGSGKLVLHITKLKDQLNISLLPAGNYVLTLICADGRRLSKRFIKTRE